jgi:type I restriction enzyme, R subunit
LVLPDQAGGKREDTPSALQEPPPESTGTQAKQKTLELQKLLEAKNTLEAECEKELEQLREELRAAREKASAAEAEKDAVEQALAQTEEQFAAIKAEGQAVATLLELNEEETRRRLIDEDLVAVGWNVGDKGKSTEEVGQEVEVTGLPKGYATGTNGKGRIDYVLWDDSGKPLAVIEAQRKAKDAAAGRTQAHFYADALEKQYGQRPVVFYTNGPEIYSKRGYTWLSSGEWGRTGAITNVPWRHPEPPDRLTNPSPAKQLELVCPAARRS